VAKFSIMEGIIPANPEVSVAEYLHFTSTLGDGGIWSLLGAPSGGSIQADTGVYGAGLTGDVTDIVSLSLQTDSATTTVMVATTPRDPGVVGPPTSMDLDGGGVGITDVILILRAVVGLDTPTPEQQAAADFNCNGSVDISDVINCLRIVVGLPPVL
jgi:hypothetical protein